MILNTDLLMGYDHPRVDRLSQHVAGQEQEAAYNRISAGSVGFRAAFDTVFNGAHTHAGAQHLAHEVEQQGHDLGDDPQHEITQQKARLRAVRTSVPEEDLVNIRRLPLPPSIGFNTTISSGGRRHPNAYSNQHQCRIVIDLTHERTTRQLLSEEQLVLQLLSRTNLNGLAPRFTLLDASTNRPYNFASINQVPRVTPAQARAIAREYRSMLEPYQNIEAVLSHGGVSRMNVLMALDALEEIASNEPNKLPGIIAKLRGSSTTSNQEVQRINARLRLVDALGDLKKAIGSGRGEPTLNMTQMTTEITTWNTVLDGLQAAIGGGPNVVMPPNVQRVIGAYADTAAIIAAGAASRVMDRMTNQITRLDSANLYYRRVHQCLDGIRTLISAAEVSVPSALSGLIGNTVNTGAIDNNLTYAVAEEAITQLGFDVDALRTERTEKAAAAKKPSDALKGRDAALEIYEEHFRALGYHDNVRQKTEFMFNQNEVGFQEVQLAQQIMEHSKVFGHHEGVMDNVGRQFKQLWNGSQETFMVNLGEELGVHFNHGSVPDWRLWQPWTWGNHHSTRRLRSPWAKYNARPAWGQLHYTQLMTAYFALRKAVSEHLLPNNHYVCHQRDEIARILVAEHPEEMLEDMEQIDPTTKDDSSERDESLAFHRQRLQRAIRFFFGAQAPSEYEAMAAEAVQHAQHKTGAWRRSAAEGTWGFIKNRASNVFKGKGSKLNPLTMPARLIKFTWNAPFKAYNWLMSPHGGGGGHGHHGGGGGGGHGGH